MEFQKLIFKGKDLNLGSWRGPEDTKNQFFKYIIFGKNLICRDSEADF